MPSANLDLIRAINQFNILNTIRSKGAVSRVEISAITGQSRASVTTITARMIKVKLIYEKEHADSTDRGRKRVLLALNPDAAFVIGVKLSGFRVCCALCDMQGEIRSSVIIPVRTRGRKAEFIADLIEDSIRYCVNETNLGLGDISGIGIGLPGLINARTGICHWTPLYEMGDTSIRELIRRRLNIQTYVDNDANTVTLAHQWFGAGRGCDNFIVVSIEDGVGMGIIVNGQLYRGHQGFAGEFGHMPVEQEGAECICGNKGCLVMHISNTKILAAAEQAASLKKWRRENNGEVTIEEVVRAAHAGEPVLREIFSRGGHFLGVGLSGLIQIFDPEKIIISGQGVEAGDLIFKSMHAAIEAHTIPVLRKSTQIVIPKWEHTDWAHGAASLVLQELYKSPFNRVRPLI